MTNISMETRDQWYKPNLLYNIHWRPPKKPEQPKMVVETVQFNQSVCTCGKHDCVPRYRMERKVVWTNKEMSDTKMKMKENDEWAKRDTSLSKHEKHNCEVIGVKDGQNKEVSEEDNSTEKKGFHWDDKLKIDNGRKCSENGSGGTSINDKRDGDGVKTDGQRENIENACGVRDGNGVTTDGQRKRSEHACDGIDGDSVKTDCYRESSGCSRRESDEDGMKTDRQRETSGESYLGSNGVTLKTEVYRESRADDCYDDKRDGSKVTGEREDGNTCNGGSNGSLKVESYRGIGKSGWNDCNDDDLKTDVEGNSCTDSSSDKNSNESQTYYTGDREERGRNGEEIERKGAQEIARNSSCCKGDDDGIRLKINDNRSSNGDAIHIGSGAIDGYENRTGENDVTNDGGCDDVEESFSVDNVGETVGDGCSQENVPPHEDRTNYNNYESGISPAFGILSIYCNSEIHSMAQSSYWPNNP